MARNATTELVAEHPKIAGALCALAVLFAQTGTAAAQISRIVGP